MDNSQQPHPEGEAESPNLAQLDLKGETTSALTQAAQDEMKNGGKPGEGEDGSSAEPGLRTFRISCPEDSEQFCSNYIKTTKYTLISWLPMATLYQYKKLANWYFLLMAVLSTLPLSPWSGVTMILPTAFVLVVSVLREGIEDFARHQSDKLSNKQSVKRVLLDGTLEAITSGEVHVGDLLYVADDEDIPADILLLGGGIRSDDSAKKDESRERSGISQNFPEGQGEGQINFNSQAKCFLQTSSLDGEKNLKKKVTPQGFKAISLEPLHLPDGEVSFSYQPIDGTVVCDLPNNDLHQFNGSLKMKSSASGKPKTFALGPKQLLLKGSKLINTTNGILGVVVYTGIDTKLMQNQTSGQHKQSKLEKQTNKFVVRLLILHLLVSVILSWQSYRWESTEGDGQYYLYSHTDPQAKPSQQLSTNFFLNFLSGFLINSTFVPISLIVTLEIVKMLQAYFISWDFEMVRVEFDEGDVQVKAIPEEGVAPPKNPQKQPISYQQCKVLNSSINEELGQVRYVFSDKTGTLTMNSMEFRLCKIGHFVYGDQQNAAYIGPKFMQDPVVEKFVYQGPPQPNHLQVQKKPQIEHNECGSESIIQSNMSQRSSVRSTINRKQGASYNYHNLQLEQILFGNDTGGLGQPEHPKCTLHVHSKNGKASLVFDSQKHLIAEFLQCIATTHECVPEEKKAKLDDGNEMAVLGYQGPSPDEVALLEFAQNHGFEYTKGTDDCLQVTRKHKLVNYMSNANSLSSLQPNALQKPSAAEQVPAWINDGHLNFKLLKRIEFSSDRKRMSVIVQDMQDGLVKLYCKGADNIIKERLKEGYVRTGKYKQKHMDTPSLFDLKKPSNDAITEEMKMMDETEQFLQQCSMDGYRTLLVAMRVLDADEANQFMTECTLAESDILNKDQKLQQVYDKWERDLCLLGATVLEDRLQENVQSTIQALHQADIKVWVLTGDKLETAESIGYSSKLLNLGMDVLHCRDADDVKRLFNREQASQQEADILSGQQKALIIESEALKLILSGKDLKLQRYFLKITKNFETVVCCRVSPKQKAEVVKLVKNDDPEAVTLAIGDGANDVSMILEADLGIGLFGKEGMRAADSSDFAICEFQHLWPLLFKQGRWLYARMSFLVIYSLYKAFLYTIMQVLFARVNCYSFQTVFPDFFLTMFGTWFTAWPVPFHACIDLDIFPSKEKEDSEDDLMHFEAYDPSSVRKFVPSLYYPGQRNLLFNQYTLLWWLIRGLYEGVITYFIVAEVFEESLHTDGQPGDHWTMGITMFTCVMFIITFKLLLKHKKIDWHVPACHLILSSIGNYMTYLVVTDSWVSFKNHFTFNFLFTSPVVYLTIILVVGICFLIDFALESVSHNITTSSNDLVRYQTLEKGAEETREFLDEFERLTKYQRNLGLIKDSVREQQLDYKRAIQAGLAQDELREEMRLNQTFERNIGGIKGMFQNMQGKMMGTPSRASKVSTSSRGFYDAYGGRQRHEVDQPGQDSSFKLDEPQPSNEKPHLSQIIMRHGNAAQDRISRCTNSKNQVTDEGEIQMEGYELRTPEKSQNRDITRVKYEKKSLMSSQKNLVSPYNNDPFQQASPALAEEGQRVTRDFTPTVNGIQSKSISLVTNNNLKTTKTKRESQVQLSNLKSEPGSMQAQSRHQKMESMTFNQARIAGEGFIDLQRSSSKHAGDKSSQIMRIDCFDRSFDSKRGSSSKRHRVQNSVLSSKQVNESIAEEPPSIPPGKALEPKGYVEKTEPDDIPLDEAKVAAQRADSATNSIYNLQVEVNEELQEDEHVNGKRQYISERISPQKALSPAAAKDGDLGVE